MINDKETNGGGEKASGGGLTTELEVHISLVKFLLFLLRVHLRNDIVRHISFSPPPPSNLSFNEISPSLVLISIQK